MLYIVNLFNFIVKILYYYVSKMYVIKMIELKLYYDDDEGKWMNE